MINSNDTIGYQTHDLPACSAVLLVLYILFAKLVSPFEAWSSST